MNQPKQPDYDATKLETIQKAPLIIAVAGHANHGKTSILRTLCRMPEFGEVSDLPGTTRNVSGVKFKIDGKTYMLIFDTPGFQNSTKAIEECGEQFTIDDVLRVFEHRKDFGDDFKALEQVLASHVVLYVIDGACEPTESLQNDFRVLARSGIPVIPIFNFSKDGDSQGREAWVDFLHHNNYHLEVKYDAHYYRPEYEYDLYDRIRILLKNPLHREFFDWYVEARKAKELNMSRKAEAEMAEMLVDCAAYRHCVSGVESSDMAVVTREATDRFMKTVGRRECQAFQNMVAAYEFKPDLLERATNAEDRKALWQQDLFGKEIQRHLGIGVIAGAIAGAGVGFVVDSAMGWHSLFLGTLVGAATGAVVGACGAGLYNAKWDRTSHTLTIESTDKMCHALVDRGVSLLESLRHRGMADQRDFVVTDKALRSVKEDVERLLKKLTVVAENPHLSLIGVDPATISSRAKTERNEHLATIEGLIGSLVSKIEEGKD